jgi:hypothetical protein
MSKTGLSVIMARNAPVGVVFRRGPSKQTLLIRWNLRDDSFEQGQWFKGRIYTLRCDLSPSGEKLIYFAADYHPGGPGTWTAISKPPYLTALAMWPKGDAWGGGGLFETEYKILLNHRDNERTLADDFQLGRKVTVSPFGLRPGWGEDDPIHHRRLLRDGWILKQHGITTDYQSKGPASWRFIEPKVYAKGRKRRKLFLLRKLNAVGERQGDWYVIDHEIRDSEGKSLMALPRTSWADWDSNGDLLFAERGKLFRLPSKAIGLGRAAANELADFSGLTFSEKKAPATATRW